MKSSFPGAATDPFSARSTLASVVDHEGSSRLMVRVPLTGSVMPYREALRRRSSLEHAIIHARLEKMKELGKIASVPNEEAFFVVETVLVDKHKDKPIAPTILAEEELHSRFRICFDLKPLNQLKLVRAGDEYVWVRDKESREVGPIFSTRSASDILATWPIKERGEDTLDCARCL